MASANDTRRRERNASFWLPLPNAQYAGSRADSLMAPPADLRDRQHSPYRWVILAMVSLSGFVTMGFPIAGLSALFSEIAESLQLDLIQIGVIWGTGMVMGVFTAFIGGSLIDYFGTRRALVFMCLAAGVFSALRGLAVDFWSLLLFSFFYGTLQPVLPLNFIKLNREWFSSRQLGFAAGSCPWVSPWAPC